MSKLRPKDSQYCPNCNTMLALNAIICSNCGSKLVICKVCERGFTMDQEKLTCVHCNESVHSIHVVRGICPLCSEKLFIKQID